MNPSTFFNFVIAAAKTSALQALLPPVIAFLQNVQKNPAPVNVIAQAAVLNTQVLAALPNLAQSEIQTIAQTLATELTNLQAAVQPTPK